ncbi:MAG: hypothetical protein QM831_13090 [Kofleriaceae bacterium]
MELLDRIQTLAAIEAFDRDAYAQQLAAEFGPASTIQALEQRDAELVRTLGEIEDVTARVMRIRLEHVANEMPVQTRRVFASTIASYADKLETLEDRVRSTRVSEAVIAAVMTAAAASLELRDALRTSALTLIQNLAQAAIPDADRNARDVQLDEAQRKKWSQVRRDLEVLAVDPDRIRVATMAKRIAAWPEQLDEPPEKPDVTFADMIELD